MKKKCFKHDVFFSNPNNFPEEKQLQDLNYVRKLKTLIIQKKNDKILQARVEMKRDA